MILNTISNTFIFRSMTPIEGSNITDEQTNEILINFHCWYAKPQQSVWSCLPIQTILRIQRTDLIRGVFNNWHFDISRGTKKKRANSRMLLSHSWIRVIGSVFTIFWYFDPMKPFNLKLTSSNYWCKTICGSWVNIMRWLQIRRRRFLTLSRQICGLEQQFGWTDCIRTMGDHCQS